MENEVTFRLSQPHSTEHWRQARRLIEQYAASLDFDLSFQNLADELDHLASEYDAPAGAFLLAEDDGGYIGCVGLRYFSDGSGEVERLYVIPDARGLGAGRLLAEGIVAAARRLGYARLVLDTVASMQHAQSLYVSLGFKPTEAYRFNPLPGAAFFELKL